MITTTATREQVSRTRIEVTRPAHGGRSKVVFAVHAAPDRPVIRPGLLSSDDRGARVSLVPEGALLLAGDRIAIDVEVGPGARVELVEPSGTVAYAMDGATASWDVTIRLGAAASLVWAGQPFVVAAGADVDRRTTVELGWGAVLALRENLVLGRHGEPAGTLRQYLSAAVPGPAPLLHETLEVGADSDRLLIGGRAITSVITLGRRLDPIGDEAGVHFDLDATGTVVRAVGNDAHECALDRAWAAARSTVLWEDR